MTEKFMESMLYDLLKGCNIDDIIDDIYTFLSRKKHGIIAWTADGSIFDIAIKKGEKNDRKRYGATIKGTP